MLCSLDLEYQLAQEKDNYICVCVCVCVCDCVCKWVLVYEV